MSGRPPSPAPSPPPSLPRGLVRLARFRADGLAAIPATPRGFLQSLAAQLVLPVLGGLAMLAAAPVHVVLLYVLANVVALLAPPVISHAMVDARRRDTLWLRYATAYNWCQLLIALLFTALGLLGRTDPLQSGGPLSPLQFVMLLLAVYSVALNWFLIRVGLEMPRGQTTVVFIGIWFATMLLLAGPFVLSALLLHGLG